MNDNRPIGIFDSGVGGLSILLKVREILPHESIVYLADQKNVPYGTKTPEEIVSLSSNAASFLLGKNVKAIIVGCNSATVHALEYLRSKYNVPIIGTVPVVKTLVEKTKTGKVAVFSTPATAKSQYLNDLIDKFGDGKKVYIVGESGLEEFVEKGNLKDEKIHESFEKYLKPLIREGVDSIALGCTHYPFLRDMMQEVVGDNVGIYDSGSAIARQVKRVLENESELGEGEPKITFYTTGDPEKFKEIAEKLLGTKVDEVLKAGI